MRAFCEQITSLLPQFHWPPVSKLAKETALLTISEIESVKLVVTQIFELVNHPTIYSAICNSYTSLSPSFSSSALLSASPSSSSSRSSASSLLESHSNAHEVLFNFLQIDSDLVMVSQMLFAQCVAETLSFYRGEKNLPRHIMEVLVMFLSGLSSCVYAYL